MIKAGKPITLNSPTQEEIKELEALRSSTTPTKSYNEINNQSNVNSPVEKVKNNTNSSSQLSSPSLKSSSQHSSPSNGCGGKLSNSPAARSKGGGSLNGNNNNNYNGKRSSIASPKGSMVLNDEVDKNSLAAKKNSKRACCVVQ